ncbi:MAG: ABC transporter ATP-binding protein [Actinocatenispora sp.]
MSDVTGQRLGEPAAADAPVLSVRDLVVEYRTSTGPVRAVRGATFDLRPRESLALVGESGCGKTTLGLALLRLLPKLASTPHGEVTFRRADGTVVDLLAMRREQLRRFRWNDAAMVFQGAMNALNPVLRIADQMHDTIRAHRSMSGDQARKRCVEVLDMVRLEPDRVLPSYPHELSGGMRQRVLIAMALLLEPRVLVLDEPTTALDILTQRSIVDVLQELRRELGFAMVFVTHDLALAAELADRVATMYAGRIVELGTARDIFTGPRHPYTAGLIRAVPPVVGEATEISSIPGGPPSLADLPSGCPFRVRCPLADDVCERADPDLVNIGGTHETACHFSDRVEFEREVVIDGV